MSLNFRLFLASPTSSVRNSRPTPVVAGTGVSDLSRKIIAHSTTDVCTCI